MDELWVEAEAQHGVFARWQATARGVSSRALAGMVRRGDLDAVSPRVFRVRGAPRTPEQDLLAAVLDGGRDAVASRRSAAWLWELPGFEPGWNDVLRRRPEARTTSRGRDHWPVLVPDHHLTVVRGIPVTTLARTFFDLIAMPRYAGRVGQMIDTVHGTAPSILVALHQMLPELARQGRNGIAGMRLVLAERPPDTVPRTGLERRFEHILTHAGLAVPRPQVDLGGHSWIGRVDYYDDELGIIYEIDSMAHHASLSDRCNDERRDAEALAAGFKEVVRIPEEHVWYEPQLVVSAVRRARTRRRRAS